MSCKDTNHPQKEDQQKETRASFKIINIGSRSNVIFYEFLEYLSNSEMKKKPLEFSLLKN